MHANGAERGILVVRRGGLGDPLLLLPVLRALRRAHRHAPLVFAGVRDHACVLERYGAVDRAVSSEDLALWALRAGGDAATRARARCAAYGLVIGDDPALASLARDGAR